MAGILKKEDILEQKEIENALESIGKKILNLADAFDKVAASAAKVPQSLGGASKLNETVDVVNKVKKNTEELTAVQKDRVNVETEMERVTARLINTRKKEVDALLIEKKLLAESTKQRKELIVGTKEYESALKRQKQSILDASNATQKLDVELKKLNDEYRKLEKADLSKLSKGLEVPEQVIQRLRNELEKTDLVIESINKKRVLVGGGEGAKELSTQLAGANSKAKSLMQEIDRLDKLPSQLNNGTVSFNKFITSLTQAPLQLQRMNQEYAELERESERQLEIEKKRTAEIEKQNRLTAKQRIERLKLSENVNFAPIGSSQQIGAQVKVLEFDKKHADNAAEVTKLTEAIARLNAIKKEFIATNKKQEQAQKLLIAAQNAEHGSAKQLVAVNKILADRMKHLNVMTTDGAAKFKQLDAAMQRNKGRIAEMNANVHSQSGAWDRLGKSIMTYATAYLSVQAVIGAGKAFFNQTKELDQLSFSMKTVIKSSVELADTQKFLSELAVNYGGDLLTLSERYIKFRAAAMQSNMSALETRKIFDTVSKAAGTLGLKTDELSGVYLALEQMISKGKVTTEELRRQLGERLPGAFGIMANALGVTLPQLDAMLKKGEVLSKDALPKFAVALEKAYGIENLKKIDTLAAAQGRMSTEVTKLIEAFKAGDTFKGVINFLASFLHLIRENIGFVSALAKSILIVAQAWLGFKIAIAATVAIQKLSVILTGSQVASIRQLTAVQLKSAEATWVSVRATSTLSTAMKSFGGWVSILINVLIAAVTAFALFGSKAKAVTEEVKDFEQASGEAKDRVDELYKILGKTATTSNLHKEALRQLNEMSLKYNTTLQTENGLLADSIRHHQDLKIAIEAQLKAKYKSSEKDTNQKKLNDVEGDIKAKFHEVYTVYDEAEKKFAEFKDLAESGEYNISFEKLLGGGDFGAKAMFRNLKYEVLRYKQEEARILGKYGEDAKAPNNFDLQSIKDAEDEFKKLDELTRANKANGTNIQLKDNTYSSEYKSYEDFLLAKLKLADKYGNAIEAKEAIGLALGGEIKDTKGGSTKDPSDKNELKRVRDLVRESEDINKQLLKTEEEFQKDMDDLVKSDIRQAVSDIKDKSNAEVETTRATIDELQLQREEAGIDQLRSTKGNADLILKVQQDLARDLIQIEIDQTEWLLEHGEIVGEERINQERRLRKAKLDMAKEGFQTEKENTEREKQLNDEKLRAIGDAVNESFEFSQQIFSNQENAIKKRYDNEVEMAGDSVEGKIIAERKYEQETNKIKRKQAITDKAQAAFNIGLSTAMAIMKVTAQTGVGAALLVPLIVATGALQLATVLAKPIPEYFMGTENLKEATFSAGERGAELITKPDGTQLLTPDTKTIFSDKSFVGSSILPADKTAAMLQAYSMTQSNQIIVDMSLSNKHLQTIANNTKSQEQRSYSAQGKLTIKRGNTVTTYN